MDTPAAGTADDPTPGSLRHWPWLPIAAGFLAMYIPVYWSAANGIWQADEFGHAPMIVVLAAWLFWRARKQIVAEPAQPAQAAGWALFALGVLLYVFGRSLSASSVEFTSQVAIVAAGLLLLRGWRGLRAAWFPVFYLIFVVPLPGTLVDAVTGPLKHGISNIVVDTLYAFNYPIARNGVVITVGQYQLLVADACSGLNSMVTLSALGTLFIHLMARKSTLHNVLMLASIIPIAFFANIVRVTLLVLVTYHFGDEAGQGFLHGAAGILLMLVALAVFFALDGALNFLASTRRHGDRPTTA